MIGIDMFKILAIVGMMSGHPAVTITDAPEYNQISKCEFNARMMTVQDPNPDVVYVCERSEVVERYDT